MLIRTHAIQTHVSPNTDGTWEMPSTSTSVSAYNLATTLNSFASSRGTEYTLVNEHTAESNDISDGHCIDMHVTEKSH